MEEESDVYRENIFINYVENFLYELYQHLKSQKHCESCNALAISVGIEEIVYKKAYSENQIMNQMNSIPLWKKTEVLNWYKRQCDLILRNFQLAKVCITPTVNFFFQSEFFIRELIMTGGSFMTTVLRIQVEVIVCISFLTPLGKAYSFLTASNFLSRIQQVKASSSRSTYKNPITKKRPLATQGERPIPKKAKTKGKLSSTTPQPLIAPHPLETIGVSLSESIEQAVVQIQETRDVFEDFKFDDDVADSVDEFLFDTQSLKVDSMSSVGEKLVEKSDTVIDDVEWQEAQRERRLSSQRVTKSLPSTDAPSIVVDDSQLTEEVPSILHQPR